MEPTKSIPDLKNSISQHAQQIQAGISATSKDLGTLTKNLFEKDSAMVNAFKNSTAQDLKDVQARYVQKEDKVINYLHPGGAADQAAKEYERILQDNVAKLKEIAVADFKSCQETTKNVTEETKAKLHEFITTTFNSNATNDFTEAASKIFKNVNQKVKDDMLNKNSKLEYSTASVVPDVCNMFVNPMIKSPEELEAEKVLREIFEREIVEFNDQIKKDFEQLKLKFGQEVNTVMDKVCESVQFAQVGASSEEFAGLPPKTTVEETVSNLLNRTKEDFKVVNDNVQSDVQRKQATINRNVRHYAGKMLGKNFLDETEE